jgi:putative hydrolase of the HAD superfamily
LRPLLGSLDLLSRFDHVHISAEVEAEKPDRAFFLSLADALDLPPEAITHLGDEPVADVEGARAAGLRAALWAGGEPYPSVGLEPEP